MTVGMHSLEHGFDAISRLLNVVCGFFLCVMAVHVVADVSSRYLFNTPLTGTIEIVSNYYMVIVIFLPLPYITHRRAHFSAEVFTDLAPPQVFRLVLLFADLLTAVLAAFATWQSYVTAVDKTLGGEAIETTLFIVLQWPARWLLVIGFCLMCIASIILLFNDLARVPTRPGASKATPVAD